MILILDDPKDLHTGCVRVELQNLGIESAVLDTRHFGRGGILGVDSGGTGWLTCSATGKRSQCEEFTAVWLRRPGRFNLSGVIRESYVEFATREWRDLFWGWLDAIAARFVNPLGKQERATKIRQLHAARAVGLMVPDTVVSNEAAVIAEFVEAHAGRVVHKSLTQQRNLPMFTMGWDDEAEAALDVLDLCPVLVQERIDGPGDIRVTMIGEKTFAAMIATPPNLVDSRLVEDLPYRNWSLSPDLETALQALMAQLGLCFGTIDLKLAHDGTPYFLEVNPQGQFAYIEIVTGLPLVREMACFLAGRA